jgi:hypothetical protein
MTKLVDCNKCTKVPKIPDLVSRVCIDCIIEAVNSLASKKGREKQ